MLFHLQLKEIGKAFKFFLSFNLSDHPDVATQMIVYSSNAACYVISQYYNITYKFTPLTLVQVVIIMTVMLHDLPQSSRTNNKLICFVLIMQRLAAQGPTQALVPIIEVIDDLQTHKFYMIWPMIIVIDLPASPIFGKQKKINK